MTLQHISNNEQVLLGNDMHAWATDLFPVCRSITGKGVRDTLEYLKNLVPELLIKSIPSGTQAFDWVVPDEWTINDAFIIDKYGNKVVDFKKNNLHLMSYSSPIDIWLSRDELELHLHSLPELPDAIPYVTSYYSKNWGFCLSDKQRKSLPKGQYRVVIDSELKPGVLNYGELILPGESEKEIFLSTYVCHPSMANNELSGPVVTIALARWLKSQKTQRQYTYRIVFIPETIGSIVYLSQNSDLMKERTIAGFNITCVGDERCYSYLPSRQKDSLSDRVAKHILKNFVSHYESYSFLDRGSDERQYCSPKINLPIASVMRSKYGTYPEYHTSLDDLKLITPAGLSGAFNVLHLCLSAIEENFFYTGNYSCEPQLGKRGLYPLTGTTETRRKVKKMMNFLAYADGSLDLLEISEIIKENIFDCAEIAKELISEKVIKKNGPPD